MRKTSIKLRNSLTGLFAAIILSATAMQFNSCDFLGVDDYFNETLKYDSVFTNKYNIERYIWATAATFPDEAAIWGNNYTPGPFATDEGFTLFGQNEFRGMSYVVGNVTPTNLYSMNTWNSMYLIIRKVNTILSRINEVADMTSIERMEFLGYVYFMRAYAYYHLAMKYGPVVLLGDEVLNNNEEAIYYDRARNTYDETCDYICSELEKAAQYLPYPNQIAITDFGRPHRGAALGLVARLRLMQASPLYNPSPTNSAAITHFGEWKRRADGVNYISQTYDERKWAVAAMAAKRVMDLGIFSLYTVDRMSDSPALPANVSSAPFPDGAGNIDPFHSFADMFTGEAIAARNPEFVWARNSTTMASYTRHAFPINIYGGYSGLCVTQKVIDAFRMADGRDIRNSSAEYPYQTTGTLGRNITFSDYQLRTSVHNMYVNREMRFYASIGFSGRFWPCNSTSDNSYKNIQISYEASGNSGKNVSRSTTDYAITGYVLTKFIHPDDAWVGAGAQRLQKSFPIMRYSEILLSYAEALNNLTQSHSFTDETNGETYAFSRDRNEIARAFNQVRYRAGLPGLTDEELDSPSELQEAVERERMVEFLFEDRRYFDVRRWGKYEETENELIMGMNIDVSGDGYYTAVPINHAYARNRVIDRKLILFPLELNEVRKSPSLDQNPGWQE
jgi:hypothetical protein